MAAVDVAVADVAAEPDPAPHDPVASELEIVRKERSDLAERLLRTAADFDNFRKRTRREVEDAKLRGRDEAIRELLPVFDNLERAMQASTSASDANAVLEGVRMVLKLFEDTAQRMGLSRIPTVGERFDPAVHEAIQQQETNDHSAGTIVAEVAPGYVFGKRLLRAAMVVVARRPTEAKVTPESPAATEPVSGAGGEPEAGAPEGDAKTGEPTDAAPEGASA